MNGAGMRQPDQHILTAEEIVAGGDDLGVFLYGHAKGAMWYGSRLSCAEARRLAPYQNATGMQVTSAVLAAMVWVAENPNEGFVEADEMDHARCLAVQRPYLDPSSATTPTGPRSGTGSTALPKTGMRTIPGSSPTSSPSDPRLSNGALARRSFLSSSAFASSSADEGAAPRAPRSIWTRAIRFALSEILSGGLGGEAPPTPRRRRRPTTRGRVFARQRSIQQPSVRAKGSGLARTGRVNEA